MTILESKTIRDSYGIDTFERGAVYSALLLRASNTHPSNSRPKQNNPYYNAIRIALAPNNNLLVIQAKFPYSSNVALREGGSFIENLGVFNNANPNPFLTEIEPSNPRKLLITSSPFWVDTLERYFAWTASNLLFGFLSLTSGQQQATIQFLEEDPLEPSIVINLSLPIVYRNFLKTNSLIYAVTSTIDTTFSNDSNNLRFDFSNQSNLDNNSLIGN